VSGHASSTSTLTIFDLEFEFDADRIGRLYTDRLAVTAESNDTTGDTIYHVSKDGCGLISAGDLFALEARCHSQKYE
jgi:hypothetical protein